MTSSAMRVGGVRGWSLGVTTLTLIQSDGQGTLSQLFRILLAKPQDSRQRFVNAPLLIWGDPSNQVAKPPGVDSADLLDENAGSLAEQVYLWAERCWPGAQRGRCDQNHRAGQQLVSLHDHSVAATVLLVTRPSRRAEFVNVTPQHACSP